MPHYKYLIVGGGMTADAAARAIRKIDSNGSMGIVSAETVPPYDRPPLSKKLWTGEPLESIWRKTESLGADLHVGRTIQSIDPGKKSTVDDQGRVRTFDKLLLATGGAVRRLPFGTGQIIYFRTLRDYEQLRKLAETKSRFAVIGGGFIGSEIAAALSMVGRDVVLVFPGEGIGSNLFPLELSLFLNDYYRKKGVDVWAGESAVGLKTNANDFSLETRGHGAIPVDGVVAGIGTQPNVELAKAAGLKVENGIAVDSFLRTSHPDIYAAGDVASFYNPALDERLRVEHEDNANTMGQCAGRNMAGESVAYDHLPYFYSDLFELGYEAVGQVDSRLETVADWKEPFQEGVIYYLRNNRVRGVLLWNVWGQLKAARQLIAEPGPFRAEDLK
ncbi:MAG TPA: FAD-dependent oxidoreductase, partial [Acidobacteriota bacterium]|nr:FAD-dependent oxidoreductase [Acidobacteriota bacterium]